jgi:hypothetical protein
MISLFSRLTAFLWQELEEKQPESDEDEYHEMTDNRCRAGLYPGHHPVLSATIIGKQGNGDNKVKARLRFSAKTASFLEALGICLLVISTFLDPAAITWKTYSQLVVFAAKRLVSQPTV